METLGPRKLPISREKQNFPSENNDDDDDRYPDTDVRNYVDVNKSKTKTKTKLKTTAAAAAAVH